MRGATFKLRAGHTLGVVGESGSGKTTLGLTLLRLHEPSGGPAGGKAMFDGRDLLALSQAELLPMRKRIQVVFQNPYASLNPRFTIGQTLVEPMTIHGIGADDAERARARLRAARQGRPRRERVPQVPARVLGRPAPARRDRALPDARARGARPRRGGERARRLGAGAGAEPAEGPAGRARPVLHLHQPRPRGGPLHGRRGAGDEGRRGGRAGRASSRSSSGRSRTTRAACSPRSRAATRRRPDPAARRGRAPRRGAARAASRSATDARERADADPVLGDQARGLLQRLRADLLDEARQLGDLLLRELGRRRPSRR